MVRLVLANGEEDARGYLACSTPPYTLTPPLLTLPLLTPPFLTLLGVTQLRVQTNIM